MGMLLHTARSIGMLLDEVVVRHLGQYETVRSMGTSFVRLHNTVRIFKTFPAGFLVWAVNFPYCLWGSLIKSLIFFFFKK